MLKRLEPPHVLLAAITLMAVLHVALPGTRLLVAPWNMVGVMLVVFGMALNQAALRALKQAQTTTHTRGMPSTLVTEGVFRLSRHPIYLGFTSVLLGCAMILGTLTPFLVVPLYVLATDRLFITPEEQRLALRFRGRWDAYRADVRRWL